MERAQPEHVEFHGAVEFALIGDHTSVTIHQEPPRLPAPFLAPSRSSGLLVGRKELRDRIRGLLCERAVALCGLPGAGKTALALDLAYDQQIRARFPDGILWAGLGAQGNVQRHLADWGEHVGLRSQDLHEQTAAGWSEALHRKIGQRRFLLVVDDAWDPDDALALQVGGPNCAQLVTTRFPGVALEFGGAVLHVDELAPAEGLHLLEALAEETVRSNREAAAQLVALVGGLPLALTLMGHHLREAELDGQHGVTEALARLRQAEQRLRLVRRQAPSAAHPSIPGGLPISLLAVLDLGYARLPAVAQQALRDLAVFPPKPNSYGTAAALAVTGADPETLRAVVRAGLIESGGADRQFMHQVVHDYVQAKGVPVAVERRMAEVYVGMVVEGAEGAGEGAMSSEQFQQELGNVLQALDHAHRHDMHETLLAGVDAAYPMLMHRGLYSVAEPHLKHALRAARAVGDARAEARTLLRLGNVTLERGDLREGSRYLDEGMQCAQQNDSVGEIVDLLLKMGWGTGMRGDLERARRHFSDALIGAEGAEAVPALQGLGWVMGLQGRHNESGAHLHRGLELARESGQSDQIAGLLQVSGWMRALAGDYAASAAHFEECLELSRTHHLDTDEVDALHGLGWLATERGHYARARSLLTEALRLARERDYHERVPIMVNLARVMDRTGDLNSGGHLLREAEQLVRAHDRPEKLSDALRELGRHELATGAPEASELHLRESLRIAERIAMRGPLAGALEALAEFELARGRIPAARELLLRAMRLERGNAAMLARLRLSLAATYEAENDLAMAEDLFRAAAAGAGRTGQDELTALALAGAARALASTGDPQDAQALGAEALERLRTLASPRANEVERWLDGFRSPP
ncbi:NB-ARC domain-containing protein [Streptomyces herbicida]|uniref:NB-ARC domain-containing protein n=1 Tax=Streptomyces herbicida TaxID=3065675 RepID=UPI00292FC0EF|nr:NB-ARC domain-containing protein [Streptomyces sp. NEAU-HV9]